MNKQKRNKFYRKALKAYNTPEYSERKYLGLCCLFSKLLYSNVDYWNVNKITESKFPELYMFKETDTLNYWLNIQVGRLDGFENLHLSENIEMRKTVLKLCIEMTKSK